MKAPDFSYVRAESIDEALEALERFGDEAAVLAGGQSLVAMLNLRIAQPRVVVDINRIPRLDAIRDEGNHIGIGALTRYAAIEASAIVTEHLPLLAAALPHVAHPAVRNRGTLGGSLALADPAAELPACCLALGARLTLVSRHTTREVAMEDWFQGLYETALAPGELIAEIRLPKQRAGTLNRFVEVARRRGDFAIAGLAFSSELSAGIIRSPRLTLLGVGDRTLLARTTMRIIDGSAPHAIDKAALGLALDEDADPLEDPANPAQYRRHLLKVLACRVMDELAMRQQ